LVATTGKRGRSSRGKGGKPARKRSGQYVKRSPPEKNKERIRIITWATTQGKKNPMEGKRLAAFARGKARTKSNQRDEAKN